MTRMSNFSVVDRFVIKNIRIRNIFSLNFIPIRTSYKMLKFSVVLFLNISLIMSWYQGVYAVNYLPLTLIQRSKKEPDFVFPNELKKIAFQKNEGFTGDTKFAWNEYEKQSFFCPANEQQIKNYITGSEFLLKLRQYYRTYAIAENCLFEKKFELSDVLTCAEEPTPTIYKAQVGRYLNKYNKIHVTNDDIKCGPGDKGVLYKFAYDLCLSRSSFQRFKTLFDFKKKFSEKVTAIKMKFFYMAQTVYEICFNMEDRAKEEIFYTKHELSTIKLLKDPNLEYERDRERESDAISAETYNQGFKFQGYIDFLNTLPEGYKKKQLVSPDDRMTALLRKPTFHYINIKPMHEAVIELWNYIENYLRDNLPETEIPYEVYTGAFNVSEDTDFTPPSRRIPNFWIKVIYLPNKQPEHYSTNKSLAIVVRNEYEENKEYDNSVMKSFCMEDNCKFLKEDGTNARFSHLFQHIRCCAASWKIRNMFNVDFNVGVLLPIVKFKNEDAREMTVHES